MKTKFRTVTSALVVILISFTPSMVGIFFKPDNWYIELIKPPWTPPGWIFGPVWFCLYLSMGIAAAIIWSKPKSKMRTVSTTLFSTQLFLNGLWSFIFFGSHELLLSVIEIHLLLLFIILTIISFYKISKQSAYILLPYLFWVSFASYLNYTIWQLNR